VEGRNCEENKKEQKIKEFYKLKSLVLSLISYDIFSCEQYKLTVKD